MIGIIGFGRFGKLAARYLSEDFDVYVNEMNNSSEIKSLGLNPCDLKTCCSQKFLIICVPISAIETLFEKISSFVCKDTVIIDVCSVKLHPVTLMKKYFPDAQILGTHPMFGPDSAKNTLKSHKIVICNDSVEKETYEKILSYLNKKELVIIETTPENHDRQIATSLSLVHFIGRSLSNFGASPLDIDTEGYKRLLYILEVVENDTWQLFEDMNKYNPYAKEIRQNFINSLNDIDKLL